MRRDFKSVLLLAAAAAMLLVSACSLAKPPQVEGAPAGVSLRISNITDHDWPIATLILRNGSDGQYLYLPYARTQVLVRLHWRMSSFSECDVCPPQKLAPGEKRSVEASVIYGRVASAPPLR